MTWAVPVRWRCSAGGRSAPAMSDASDMKMGDYFDWAADLYGLPRPRRIHARAGAERAATMLLSFMENRAAWRRGACAANCAWCCAYPPYGRGWSYP